MTDVIQTVVPSADAVEAAVDVFVGEVRREASYCPLSAGVTNLVIFRAALTAAYAIDRPAPVSEALTWGDYEQGLSALVRAQGDTQ